MFTTSNIRMGTGFGDPAWKLTKLLTGYREADNLLRNAQLGF